MPVTCTNCGRVNPDGHNFCENCGRPLAAAAPVVAPPPGAMPGAPSPAPPVAPGYAAPPSGGFAPQPGGVPPGAGYAPPGAGVPPGGGYAPPGAGPPVGGYAPQAAGAPPSAYYAPPGPTPPAHRLPSGAVYGIIGGVVVLAIVLGLVFAFVKTGSKPGPANPTPPAGFQTPAPSSAPSSQPTSRPTTRPTAAPSSSGPSPTGPGGGTAGSAIDTKLMTVPQVSGFSVKNPDDQTVIQSAPDKTGVFAVVISGLDAGTTLDQYRQLVLGGDQKQWPDSAPCGQDQQSQLNTTSGAIPSTVFAICAKGEGIADVHSVAVGPASNGQTVALDNNLLFVDKAFLNEVGSAPDQVTFKIAPKAAAARGAAPAGSLSAVASALGPAGNP